MAGQVVIALHYKSYYQGFGRYSVGLGVVAHPIGHYFVGDVRADSIGTICPNIIGIITILEW